MNHRGPVLSTSTKPDMFTLTSGLRSQQGPIEIFNPQGIGGVPSTISWSPVGGCSNPQTAARRAEAFAGALGVSGTDQDRFWQSQAAEFLTATFAAADLAGGDLRLVHHWLLDHAGDAEAILRHAGAEELATSVAQLRGPSEKTLGTIKLLQNKALSALKDPLLAASVLPGERELDLAEFLKANGTLYMIASAQQDSPIAPIFAALCAEVHFVASMIGQSMDGQRLDPPLRMALGRGMHNLPGPAA